MDDYIDEPCPAGSAGPSFDDNAPVEHCSHCNEQVYNLSALMPSEAEQVISSPDVRCIRFAVIERARPRFAARPGSAAAAMLLGLGLTPQAGCGMTEEAFKLVSDEPETKTKKSKQTVRMGKRASGHKRKAKKQRARTDRSAATKSSGSVASVEEPCVVLED